MTIHPMFWRITRRVLHEAVALPGRAMLLILRGYQRFISPMSPPTCRFYPSCSQYAVIAITRHGVLRGSLLAGWRLLRCNPWNAGGVDDVPPSQVRHGHSHGAIPTAS